MSHFGNQRNNPTGNSLVQSVPPPPGPASDGINNYHPFVPEGFVSLTEGGDTVAVRILCDTGATQSLMASNVLPLSAQASIDVIVLIQGVGLEVIRVPLHQIHLQSELISGSVVVGVRPSLSVKGVTLILRNDLAGNKVKSNLQVVNSSKQALHLSPMADGSSDVYPACVVTRAAARRAQEREKNLPMSQPVIPADSVPDQAQGKPSTKQDVGNQDKVDVLANSVDNLSVSHRQLIADQGSDQEVSQLARFAVNEEEADNQAQCFYFKSSVLMRKWQPRDAPADEEWQVVQQIVVSKKYRGEILSLAYELPMAGYLGINKTYRRVLSHFYWPQLRKDVSEFCKYCDGWKT